MTTAIPHHGDVVIQRQVHSPAVYVLSMLDGPDQFRQKTYQDALARATRFAQRAAVDVWFISDGHRFKRIAQHRPV